MCVGVGVGMGGGVCMGVGMGGCAYVGVQLWVWICMCRCRREGGGGGEKVWMVGGEWLVGGGGGGGGGGVGGTELLCPTYPSHADEEYIANMLRYLLISSTKLKPRVNLNFHEEHLAPGFTRSN